ncbi:MAG: hypothetical protein ACFCU4_05620 [Puniceicoccaceae bacterium]
MNSFSDTISSLVFRHFIAGSLLFVGVLFNSLGTLFGVTIELSGVITTEEGDPLWGAEVLLSGDRAETTFTDKNGFYSFSVEAGLDLSITPVSSDGLLTGLDSDDLVLIERHLLGIEMIPTPYKLIGADVNRSGSITTLDRIEMGKILDGELMAYPNNLDWTFIDARYVFPNPSNPFAFPFPQSIGFSAPLSDSAGNNFVAVQNGDLNASAATVLIPETSTLPLFGLLVFWAFCGTHRCREADCRGC